MESFVHASDDEMVLSRLADLANVFDRVPLISPLRSISSHALTLIHSFHVDNSLTVMTDLSGSNPSALLNGEPQEPVLGTLLFLS